EVTREFTLTGHTAGIECLAISPDGRTLVSGDDAASVIVWNLTTGELVQSIQCPFNGAISAVVWIHLRDTKDTCFVFGCADGSLHVYRRKGANLSFEFVSVNSEGHDGPIEDLCFDPVHCRIASVGGGHPQVWKVSSTDLTTGNTILDNPPKSSATARSVAFYEEGCSVLVGYLESREMSCFVIEPWSLKWTRSLKSRIGNWAFCNRDGADLFITNLVDGIDQYKLPDFVKVKVFPHAIKSNFPLQVATTHRGTWVVSGGDSGFARLFDRQSGQLLQLLHH
ncbi:WD40 repeat-like protein, partial [Schizopora paradoxa]